MSLTFKNLQDKVISDRFDESDRSDVKAWLNAYQASLVESEDWSFIGPRKSLVTVTVSSSTVTNLPSLLGIVKDLIRADGTPLEYLTPEDFEDTYYDTTSTLTGLPVDYTVDNGTVKVGPLSSETSAVYELIDEPTGTEMVNDADEPVVPALRRMVLVYGAAYIGLTLAGDPSAVEMKSLRDDEVASMRRRYLTATRLPGRQLGRDPLSSY